MKQYKWKYFNLYHIFYFYYLIYIIILNREDRIKRLVLISINYDYFYFLKINETVLLKYTHKKLMEFILNMHTINYTIATNKT